MNYYGIPSCLCRKRFPCIQWRDVGLVAIGSVLGFLAFFVMLMDWGKMHAHAEGIAGMIVHGHYVSVPEFCSHQGV